MKLLKKIFLIIAGLLVFFFIIGMFAGGESEHQETIQSQTEAATISEKETSVESEETAIESEEVVSTEAVKETDPVASYTVLDFYTFLQENEVAPYTLNEKAIQFLIEHDNFFPLDIENGVEITDDTIDYSIEARQIFKNADKFGDKLMALPPAQVVQIQEAPIDDTHYITILNISDYDGQQYYVIYNGELAEIFDGDVVNVIGLPLGSSTFDNVNGGKTWVVVLAGCHITGDEPTG